MNMNIILCEQNRMESFPAHFKRIGSEQKKPQNQTMHTTVQKKKKKLSFNAKIGLKFTSIAESEPNFVCWNSLCELS